jgi:hypothetical protein
MNWYNWALLVTDERDFIAGWNIDISDFPIIKSATPNEFNQQEFALAYWYCLCTNYAPIWMLADNTWLVLNTKQRQDTVELRAKMADFNPKTWGYLSEWVKNIQQYARTLWEKVSYVRVSTKTQDFWDLYNKGYRINIWITVWETFLSDAQDNGRLDQISFWPAKFGHSTTIRKMDKDNIIDNYKDVLKYNIYSVKDLKALIDNWTIYEWAYVIFVDKEDLITNTKNKIMEEITLQGAKDAFTNWFWNGERPKEVALREEVASMIEKMYEKLKN